MEIRCHMKSFMKETSTSVSMQQITLALLYPCLLLIMKKLFRGKAVEGISAKLIRIPISFRFVSPVCFSSLLQMQSHILTTMVLDVNF